MIIFWISCLDPHTRAARSTACLIQCCLVQNFLKKVPAMGNFTNINHKIGQETDQICIIFIIMDDQASETSNRYNSELS